MQKRELTWEVDEATGCWNVTSHKASKQGHVHFTRGSQSGIGIHRWVWEQIHGQIPSDLFVCHTCDNGRCINPDHLWLGTPADNAIDMVKKGRGVNNKGERHGCSKLTTEQVLYIREHTEIDKQEMSELMGVRPAHILRLRRRGEWRHL